MASFLLRKNKGAKRLRNAQLLRKRTSTQVLSTYLLSNKIAYLIWRYIKGWVYTNDGNAIKFNDERYLKFNDQ